MDSHIDICRLIKQGGVYYNVPGKTPEDVYARLCSIAVFPEDLSADDVYDRLLEREKRMTTAVGNGIAIPHPGVPLLKNVESQRIILCYPESFLDMNAPDGRLVSALFFLFTSNRQDHQQILARMASLFQIVSIRKLLERQAPESELLAEISRY